MGENDTLLKEREPKKTIPYPAEHTCIAHIWGYPTPTPPGTTQCLEDDCFFYNLNIHFTTVCFPQCSPFIYFCFVLALLLRWSSLVLEFIFFLDEDILKYFIFLYRIGLLSLAMVLSLILRWQEKRFSPTQKTQPLTITMAFVKLVFLIDRCRPSDRRFFLS